MNGDLRVITVEAERRQIAREPLVFPKDLVPYVSWDAIGAHRQALACDLRVSQAADGSLVVSFFWPYTEDES